MAKGNEDGTDVVTIGESTRLRLGLLIGILAGVVGGIVSGVWWAATLSSKVDYILEGQNGTKAQVIATTAHVSEMQQLIQKLDWRASAAELRISTLEQKTKP
jgi:hypothetical protein